MYITGSKVLSEKVFSKSVATNKSWWPKSKTQLIQEGQQIHGNIHHFS
jgi:hypothetical protein